MLEANMMQYLRLQVEELTKALTYPEPNDADTTAGAAQGSKQAGGKGSSLPSSAAGGASGGGRGGLRGLQDVRGEWRGAVQAYGGGGGATSVDFDLKGQAWEWGDYGLDQVLCIMLFEPPKRLNSSNGPPRLRSLCDLQCNVQA